MKFTNIWNDRHPTEKNPHKTRMGGFALQKFTAMLRTCVRQRENWAAGLEMVFKVATKSCLDSPRRTFPFCPNLCQSRKRVLVVLKCDCYCESRPENRLFRAVPLSLREMRVLDKKDDVHSVAAVDFKRSRNWTVGVRKASALLLRSPMCRRHLSFIFFSENSNSLGLSEWSTP